MKTFALFLSFSFLAHAMEEQPNYLVILAPELTAMLVAELVDPYASLIEAGNQLNALSKTNKHLNSALTTDYLNSYKEKNEKVTEKAVSLYLTYVNNVYSEGKKTPSLVKEDWIVNDVHVIQSLIECLSEKTNKTKLEAAMWTVTAFQLKDYYPFKKIITENQKDAERLLCRNILKLNLQNKEDCYWQINMETIALLKHGVNPNAVSLEEHDYCNIGFIFPILCSHGRANYLLVDTFIDQGVNCNKVFGSLTKEHNLLWYLCCDSVSNKRISLNQRQLLIEKLINKNKCNINAVTLHVTALDAAYSFNKTKEGKKFIEFLRSKGAKTYQELEDESLLVDFY